MQILEYCSDRVVRASTAIVVKANENRPESVEPRQHL
jgi:hypothetical protein